MLKNHSEDLQWRAVWQCHLQHKSVVAIESDLNISGAFDATGNVRVAYGVFKILVMWLLLKTLHSKVLV